MNRFGDTPAGMVESALEFLDVCEGEGFRDIVFSMKSSNTQVAIQAYRLLAARLAERAPGAPSYPFHVGVTEAGDGEDGRIKSAIGIGALLVDGIGDTIRVSLTEPPRKGSSGRLGDRIDWLRELGRHGGRRRPRGAPSPPTPTRTAGARPAVRAARCRNREAITRCGSRSISARFHRTQSEPPKSSSLSLEKFPDLACEGLALHVSDPNTVGRLQTFADAVTDAGMSIPLAVRVNPETAAQWPACVARVVVRTGAASDDALLDAAAMRCAESRIPLEWNLCGDIAKISDQLDRALEASARAKLEEILVSVESDSPRARRSSRPPPASKRGVRRTCPLCSVISAARVTPTRALCFGRPSCSAHRLCDGIGDAISLGGFGEPERAVDLAYRILQGARLRTSRTEFISCPSCGRTLFDLVETTERIKARTGHLVGVKIAIMGCIVNGPGEMADADFGYVGSGPGRVNLYVGKDLVVRNVPDRMADDRLVELIQERGRWVGPHLTRIIHETLCCGHREHPNLRGLLPPRRRFASLALGSRRLPAGPST